MASKTVQSIHAEAERRGDEMKIKSGTDRIEQRLRYQSRAVSHDAAVTAETCSTRSSEVTRAPWLSSPCVSALGCTVSLKCQRGLRQAGEKKKKSMLFGNTVASSALFSVHTNTDTQKPRHRPVLTFYLK